LLHRLLLLLFLMLLCGWMQALIGAKAGIEMGGVLFVKKWKIGGCFVKSGPFLNAGCIMYSISIFYFTFYLQGRI